MNKSNFVLSLLVASTTLATSSAFAQSESTAPPPVAPGPAPAPAPAEQRSTTTKWIIDDATPRDRPQTIDVIASAFYFGRTPYISLGGFFQLPIVPEGFIPNVNETFSLEFGLYVDYYSYSNIGIDYHWTQITPVGGVRWDFHLTDRWSVFATVKLGSTFAIGADAEAPDPSLIAVDSGVGALWHISSMGSLRLQSTYHAPLAVGWSFPL